MWTVASLVPHNIDILTQTPPFYFCRGALGINDQKGFDMLLPCLKSSRPIEAGESLMLYAVSKKGSKSKRKLDEEPEPVKDAEPVNEPNEPGHQSGQQPEVESPKQPLAVEVKLPEESNTTANDGQGETLTEEQKKRIEENKAIALQRKRQRAGTVESSN